MTTDQLRGTCLVLLCLFAGLYFYTDEQQSYYDNHAKPAAEQILKDISNWEQATLLANLSPAAQSTLDQQQLDKLLAHYRKFGQLESIDGLEFSKLASALSLFGDARINYQSDASFSQGRARVNLTLEHDGNNYKLYNFSIYPVD